LASLLAACTGPAGIAMPATDQASTNTPLAAMLPSHTPTTTITPTATSTGTPTPPITLTPTPSAAPTHTPTITLTPEPLPTFAGNRLLRPGILPQAYISEACEYLRLRWSPTGSPPGTVVVPIFFHSIRASGRPVADGDSTTITEEFFQAFVGAARYLGYQTITTAQLNAFLRSNALIPPRSMIMIVDDRRPGVIEEHFLPVLAANNWTVTLGWISADNDATLWARMEQLNATGRLDIQSHGYKHLYILPETPEEDIRQEIMAPIDLLTQHFGQRPLAFIWPGGNFTPLAMQIAHEAEYQLGFTTYARGPLLFNWIPQGPEEQVLNDPLMLLPRFWSTDGSLSLSIGLQAADQMRAEAIARYPTEASYYQTYCQGQLPPLETILPEK
jgi:peptidoglycan/xylan/chitin deacetylase (PgdA/CDA1 family)